MHAQSEVQSQVRGFGDVGPLVHALSTVIPESLIENTWKRGLEMASNQAQVLKNPRTSRKYGFGRACKASTTSIEGLLQRINFLKRAIVAGVSG